MTRAIFKYDGEVGGLFASIGVAYYMGEIFGFHYEIPIGLLPRDQHYQVPNNHLIVSDYSGPFDGGYAGVSPELELAKPLSATVGAGYFHSSIGINGIFAYVSGGVGLLPGEVVGFHTRYKVDRFGLPTDDVSGIQYYFDTNTAHVNRGKLISDILTGDNSPLLSTTDTNIKLGVLRINQVASILIAADRFEQYYQNILACQPFYYTTP